MSKEEGETHRQFHNSFISPIEYLSKSYLLSLYLVTPLHVWIDKEVSSALVTC